MAVVINQNVFAQRAIRALNDSSNQLSRVYERLSSGQRINRPSDDPAGAAVGLNLSVRSRVLQRGERNISDGISTFELADSAVSQIKTILQRQAELAEQSANGSLSSTQRQALDKEYQELDKEIRRLANTTTFNGISLFAGDKSARAASFSISNTSGTPTISADSRYLFYTTVGGSLIQRDLSTGTNQTLFSGISGALTVTASANGERLAFMSNQNLNGLNSSGAQSIFTYDRYTNQLRKIFSATTGDAIESIDLSADGSRIALLSYATYNSNGTVNQAPGADVHIHTLDFSSAVVSNSGISLTPGGNSRFSLSISSNGSYIGFASWDSDGADSNFGVFAVANATQSLKTKTFTAGLSLENLQVLNDGRTFFASTDSPTGQNASNINQAFEYNYANNSITQKTFLTGAGVGSIQVANNGTYFTFDSIDNPTGENASGANQIFRYDLTNSQLTQETGYTSNTIGVLAARSRDGTFAVSSASGTLQIFDTSRYSQNFAFETGVGTAGSGSLNQALAHLTTALAGFGNSVLTSQSSSRGALDAAQRNLALLDSIQGSIGAGLSRLSSARNVTASQATETLAAVDRIRSADVATEAAKLTSLQIKQQSASFVAAQANLQPQIALTLLRLL